MNGSIMLGIIKQELLALNSFISLNYFAFDFEL